MNPKEEIIQDYEKYINHVLKKMNLKHRREDLFDVGMIGFVNGINTYNENSGAKLSTYVFTCIKNEIVKQLIYESCARRDAKLISYNTLVGEEKEDELLETFGYEQNFDGNLSWEELEKKILVILAEYNKRREDIFKYIYGLDGYPMLTYEEVAKIFHTSRQSICITHKTILNKIHRRMSKEILNDKKN